MKLTTIVAFFESEFSAQRAINDLISDGFDESDVSLIMKNRDLLDEEESELSENHEQFDPTDSQYQQPGTLRAIATVTVSANDYESLGSGEIVIGGPIIHEFNDTSEEEQAFVEDLLLSLGIPDEEIDGYLGMIDNGQILLSIEVNQEESAEFLQILSNHGPTIIEAYDEE